MVNWKDKITGQNGTPVNRANLMAMQGFQATTTNITKNGTTTTITETNAAGDLLVTTITKNSNNTTINAVFTAVDGATMSTTTTITKTGSGTSIVKEVV